MDTVTTIPSKIDLPPLIKDDINLWWVQVVARIKLAGITDE